MGYVLKSFNFKENNNYPFVLPRFKTRGLLFYVEGVTSGATAVDREDLGRVQILRDGKNVDTEITFEHIDALRLLYSRQEIGAPAFSSPGGAAAGFAISAYLPLHLPGDALQVDEFENAVVKVIHDDKTSILTSANMHVLAIPGLGVKSYELNHNDFSMPCDSALVTPKHLPGVRNLAAMLVDYSANHTNFRLNKDGRIVYDIDATDTNSLYSPADVVRALELELPSDAFAEASSNFLPYVFRFDKQGMPSLLGDNFAVSVKSSDATFSGSLVTVAPRDVTAQVSGQNFAAKISRNRQGAQRE